MPIGEKRRKEREEERRKKIGERLNWLTIHSEGDLLQNNCCTFNCICDCGNLVKNIFYKDIKRGYPKSCGCKKKGIINNLPENIKNKLISSIKTSDTGCWIWQKALTRSYGKMKYKGKMCHSHRVSYEVFKGEISNNLLVCHSCDNPSCINPDHLFLGNYSDNMQDMVNKNRSKRFGPRKTREEVIEIRNLYPKYTLEKLSELFKSDVSTIINIVKRKTYVNI